MPNPSIVVERDEAAHRFRIADEPFAFLRHEYADRAATPKWAASR
jgi:hypothetical protein